MAFVPCVMELAESIANYAGEESMVIVVEMAADYVPAVGVYIALTVNSIVHIVRMDILTNKDMVTYVRGLEFQPSVFLS